MPDDISAPDREIVYIISPPVTNAALNTLFAAAWGGTSESDFQKVLERSLVYVCAYHGDTLVGFVNVAWDGGIHAFLLDTTVDPERQRQGIGQRLVQEAAREAKARGMEWLHVDYEPHLEGFYQGCGFQPTLAGLMWLRD